MPITISPIEDFIYIYYTSYGISFISNGEHLNIGLGFEIIYNSMDTGKLLL